MPMIAGMVTYSRSGPENDFSYSNAREYVMVAINRYSGRNLAGWFRILSDQDKRRAIDNLAWEKELVMKGYVHDCGVAIGHVTRKLDGILRTL